MNKDDSNPINKIASKTTISFSSIIPITLALLTPIFYLNGKAFQEGYLNYLNLNASMFPQDTAGTMMSSVVAWSSAVAGGLKNTTGLLNSYWGWILVALFGLSISLGTAMFSGRKLHTYLKSRLIIEKLSPQAEEWVEDIFKIGKWLIIPTYGIYLIMFFIALALMMLLAPFHALGEQYAADQIEEEFENAPVVIAKDPQGLSGEYQIIQCSQSFCALYSKRTIITVPSSSIIWAISKATVNNKEADSQ